MRCFREPKYMENVQRALSVWNLPIDSPSISPRWVHSYCRTHGLCKDGLQQLGNDTVLDYWIVSHLESAEWEQMYDCWLTCYKICRH